MNYSEKLQLTIQKAQSNLCIGIDPDPQHIAAIPGFDHSPAAIARFCEHFVELTRPFCAAYKLNLAFFEAMGVQGMSLFEKLISAIGDEHIVIADAKRGDIGNTAQQYARAFFDQFSCDAVTVNPLMGFETLIPFLERKDKAAYVLTLTSNPGSNDFFLRRLDDGKTLFESIAGGLADLSHSSVGTIGMVLGATYPEGLAEASSLFPGAPLLVPGFGTQGGDLSELLPALTAHRGDSLLNVSRQIMFPSGPTGVWANDVSSTVAVFSSYLKILRRG